MKITISIESGSGKGLRAFVKGLRCHIKGEHDWGQPYSVPWSADLRGLEDGSGATPIYAVCRRCQRCPEVEVIRKRTLDQRPARY